MTDDKTAALIGQLYTEFGNAEHRHNPAPPYSQVWRFWDDTHEVTIRVKPND